jgi:hypothetical protein
VTKVCIGVDKKLEKYFLNENNDQSAIKGIITTYYLLQNVHLLLFLDLDQEASVATETSQL